MNVIAWPDKETKYVQDAQKSKGITSILKEQQQKNHGSKGVHNGNR